MKKTDQDKWDRIIKPRSGWYPAGMLDVWKYRELVAMFVWRDFVSIYKQTILGPLWYFIQPLLTTIVFTVVFGNLAQLPTDGLPPFMFYLSGVLAWRYFADCLTSTSNTFVNNVHLFGKVCFPRLTVPVSVVISNLIAFGIQLLLFFGFYFFYWLNGANIHPNLTVLLLPVLLAQMAMLGLGFGIITSSMTVRYRDLTQLVGFGVQLWMFITPVVYSTSSIPQKLRWAVQLNPMSPLIDMFRYAFLGTGTVSMYAWLQSLVITLLVLFVALVLFNRVEKTFMDSI
ncbi:ABC transporter permease [Geomonas edaphica]|uniref:ABC transporter permease n=1 Tax=Geomonas edaphica TaxID=2570226 RepID=UPI0010A8330B|nr:ABC transporter permease [Geomonas edaphica]